MKKKILLVDDSRTSLFVERMILQDGPWEVLTAEDGQEAVERARAERPSLILMDVEMPHMSGVEALRELRSRLETKDTPVILVTNPSERASIEEGYQIGCSGYLTKPIDPDVLLSSVECFLGRTL